MKDAAKQQLNILKNQIFDITWIWSILQQYHGIYHTIQIVITFICLCQNHIGCIYNFSLTLEPILFDFVLDSALGLI